MKPTTKLILVLGVVLFGVSSFHVVNAHEDGDKEEATTQNSDDTDVDEKLKKFSDNLKPAEKLLNEWIGSVKKNLAAESTSKQDLADRLGKAEGEVQKLTGALILEIEGLLKTKTKILSGLLENIAGVTKNFGPNVLKDLSNTVKNLLQGLSKVLGDLLKGVGKLLGGLLG